MPQSASLFFFALATILFLGALAAGWVAGSEPVSPRKGRAKFWSYACVGLAFIALAIPLMLHQATQHATPFAGTITAIHKAEGKSSSTTLLVRLNGGGNIALHINGTSPNFRPGQALQGEYASPDKTLLAAKFIGEDGRAQGIFHGNHMVLLPYSVFLLGIFFVFAGWLLYRRDPLGASHARKHA